jgi:hypothetical protein
LAIKYANLFHFKALQNLPKLGFLDWKDTIWQPCIQAKPCSDQTFLLLNSAA